MASSGCLAGSENGNEKGIRRRPSDQCVNNQDSFTTSHPQLQQQNSQQQLSVPSTTSSGQSKSAGSDSNNKETHAKDDSNHTSLDVVKTTNTSTNGIANGDCDHSNPTKLCNGGLNGHDTIQTNGENGLSEDLGFLVIPEPEITNGKAENDQNGVIRNGYEENDAIGQIKLKNGRRRQLTYDQHDLEKLDPDSRRFSLPTSLSFRYDRNADTCEATELFEVDSSENDDSLSRNQDSFDNSTDVNGSSTKSDGSRKRNKRGNWYNALSPSYKSKTEDFKRIFKDVPPDERLVVDYSCALQKDILVHGRLYVSQSSICFYANIFRWETVMRIKCKDITSITKEKTAMFIPNAISITTQSDRLFFTSFAARDKTYLMLFRVWQNALLEQPMTTQELWQWVHYSYGDELGLTASDDDYVTPADDEKIVDNLLLQEDLDVAAPDVNQSPASTADNESLVISTQSTGDDVAELPNGDQARKGPEAELPTDCSDNTEDSCDGEVACVDHEHLQHSMVNEVFQINVDQMFELIFTDSKLFRNLVETRKWIDLNIEAPWEEEDGPGSHKSRTLSYTVCLNATVGPKTAFTTEKQLLYNQSKPGFIYIVDCEATNQRVPYADAFTVLTRYCITKLTSQKCRLRISSEVQFKKSLWGMVKSMIEKNCVQGVSEHFQALSLALRLESDKAAPLIGPQASKKRVRRKRRGQNVADLNPSPRAIESTNHFTSGTTGVTYKNDDWVLKMNAETLVKILGICLVVLILFNALLYYKMSSLEGRAATSSARFLSENLEKYPQNQDEWLKVLQQQQNLHELELERWKEILTTSITLIERMKVTLVDLKRGVEEVGKPTETQQHSAQFETKSEL